MMRVLVFLRRVVMLSLLFVVWRLVDWRIALFLSMLAMTVEGLVIFVTVFFGRVCMLESFVFILWKQVRCQSCPHSDTCDKECVNDRTTKEE